MESNIITPEQEAEYSQHLVRPFRVLRTTAESGDPAKRKPPILHACDGDDAYVSLQLDAKNVEYNTYHSIRKFSVLNKTLGLRKYPVKP